MTSSSSSSHTIVAFKRSSDNGGPGDLIRLAESCPQTCHLQIPSLIQRQGAVSAVGEMSKGGGLAARHPSSWFSAEVDEPEPTAVMRHFTVTASAAAPLPSVGAWSESGARSRLARP